MNPAPLDEYYRILKATQDILQTLYGNRFEPMNIEKILTDANRLIKILGNGDY